MVSEAELGKAFLRWRTKNNISVRKAAEMLELEHTFLNRFERGLTGISLDNANKIVALMLKDIKRTGP